MVSNASSNGRAPLVLVACPALHNNSRPGRPAMRNTLRMLIRSLLTCLCAKICHSVACATSKHTNVMRQCPNELQSGVMTSVRAVLFRSWAPLPTTCQWPKATSYATLGGRWPIAARW